MASPCRFRPFRPESTAFSRRDHYRLRSGSSVRLSDRLRPSSRHGSLSEADASSESLLRRLSRDPAEPRLADPPASLPSLRSGNEGKRKTGRADVGLPGVSPGRTPVSLRSDSPVTLTRPGGIDGQRLLRRGTGERLRTGGLGLPGEPRAGAHGLTVPIPSVPAGIAGLLPP